MRKVNIVLFTRKQEKFDSLCDSAYTSVSVYISCLYFCLLFPLSLSDCSLLLFLSFNFSLSLCLLFSLSFFLPLSFFLYLLPLSLIFFCIYLVLFLSLLAPSCLFLSLYTPPYLINFIFLEDGNIWMHRGGSLHCRYHLGDITLIAL